MQKKTLFSALVAIALLVACGFAIWKLHLLPNAPETPVQETATPQLPISAAKVPDGWYSHDTYGMDRAITVLSRTEDLPTGTTTGQITVSSTDTSLSPEDFIPKQGLVGGSLDSPNVQWSWGIYQGHKTFSMTVAANGSAQWFVYVFGGHTVYEFSLSPNDQSNPNLAQDRTDFWKVITYYAQQPSFEKLSRTETQQNCKTIALPEDQEHNIQVDPENGYVVANFIQDGKNKYAFFNYGDDLSQCAAEVSKLLESVKGSASKLPH